MANGTTGSRPDTNDQLISARLLRVMCSHSVASRGNEAGRVAQRTRSGWNRGGGGQYGAGLDLIGPRPVTGDFAFFEIELRR